MRNFCKDIHETLKYVDEFSRVKKKTKLKKNACLSLEISLSLALSLSLLVDLSLHFDFLRKDVDIPVSLSLSLSIYICKNGLDPDQTRMEFRKECFVNLKICACDRKYAKCRQKPMCMINGFSVYLNKCIHCPVSCADPEGDRGSGPPPP